MFRIRCRSATTLRSDRPARQAQIVAARAKPQQSLSHPSTQPPDQLWDNSPDNWYSASSNMQDFFVRHLLGHAPPDRNRASATSPSAN
jgi:hypothetical protein